MPHSQGSAAPWWRCLTVWLLATATLLPVTGLGFHAALDLMTAPRHSVQVDQAVVALAGVAAGAVCPWLWILTSLGVLDALRGDARRHPGRGWRRVVMAACGCAATVGIALPAHAETVASPEHAGVGSVRVLDGLPYPDRPDLAGPPAPGPAPQGVPLPVATPISPTSSPDTHLVRPGDTLWSVARSTLGQQGVSDQEVADAVRHLHRLNRTVVGNDPDLIVPGQRLTLPPLHTTHRKDLR